MSSYTITIAPDDHTRATTTLRVEVTGAAARITELVVRAGDGDGITAGQLPAVDLDQLLRAVTPTAAAITATAATVAPTPTEPAPTPAAPTTPQPVADAAPTADELQLAPTEAAPTDVVATDAVATAGPATKSTTSARSRRSTTTAPKPPASGSKPSARGSGPAKAPKAARVSSRATKAAAAKKATAEMSTPRERVYRRAPEDLAQVYQQTGSAAAVADRYGVPRHTAYGWIRTLRRGTTTTAAS